MPSAAHGPSVLRAVGQQIAVDDARRVELAHGALEKVTLRPVAHEAVHVVLAVVLGPGRDGKAREEGEGARRIGRTKTETNMRDEEPRGDEEGGCDRWLDQGLHMLLPHFCPFWTIGT